MADEEKQKTGQEVDETAGQKTQKEAEGKGGQKAEKETNQKGEMKGLTEGGTGTEGRAEKKAGQKGDQGSEQRAEGNEAKTAAKEKDQARITELQGLLIGKTEELTKAAQRLAELENTVTEANERASKMEGSLKQSVKSYKTLITAANPDVLPEMLAGESVEELDASLGKARELIGKIKTGLESQSKATRVPAGAPQRGAADISGMTASEKIRVGMEKAGRG
jgi:hypothetical protein